MSMEVEMISLILDDEHVNGDGDEGDKGWPPASVVSDDELAVSDDELGDRDGLKGVGLTVNQPYSGWWACQWR